MSPEAEATERTRTLASGSAPSFHSPLAGAFLGLVAVDPLLWEDESPGIASRERTWRPKHIRVACKM